MVLISFTNIVVDEFSYGKRNPLKKYIYFLTHMHSGITPNWNFGTIYCSEVSKHILLNKFPQLQDVRTLEMNKQQKICLNEENKIEINVYLFDANHCPGSVMYMFEGYFGRILHTGDMRFNENLIYNNPILFPIEKRNKELKKVSLQIDECIFDNTYCDPIFKFPKREKACQMLTEIIDKHKHQPNIRVLICVDSLGKEELLVFLSRHYETLIVVNEQRYQNILHMDIPYQLFTTNRDQGWIEVIRKGEKQERMDSKTERCVSITCTGWANIQGYITKDDRNYLLPYSLHSNFEELELFVRSIYPSVLNTVVRNQSKGEKINNITQFSAYMITLMNLKQRGVEFFQKEYVDFSTISKEYQNLMLNSDNVSKINKALGLELTEKEKLVEDTIDFQSKHSQIYKNKKRLKNGAQLADPSNNNSICLDKFIEVKKSIEMMKEQRAKSNEASAKNSKQKNSLRRREYKEFEEEEDYNRSYEQNEESSENQSVQGGKLSITRKNQNQKFQSDEELNINQKLDIIKEKLYRQIKYSESEKGEESGDEFEADNAKEDLDQMNESKECRELSVFQSEQAFLSTQSKSPPGEINENNVENFKFKRIVKVNNQNKDNRFVTMQSKSSDQSDNGNTQTKKKQIKINVSKKISIDKFENSITEEKEHEQASEHMYNDNNLLSAAVPLATISGGEEKDQQIDKSGKSSKKSEASKDIPVFRNAALNKIFNSYLNKS